MESQIEEISPVEVELKVTVEWEDVRKDLDATYRELAKTAKVRGFRKGKVPRNVMEQLYGKAVNNDVAGEIVNKALIEAVEKHELRIVAQPKVDEPPVIKKGKALEFSARLEVQPQLEELTYEGLEVWHETPKVEDSAIESELERRQKEHADLQEVERAAKAGDRVTIDYTVTVDGEEQADLATTDRAVELGDQGLLEEIEKGLEGVEAGQTKSIDVTFPEDHGHELLQGKTATFAVSVKQVQEVLLPDLDDEFAQDLEFDTLDALKTSIREQFEERTATRAKNELQDKILDKFIEINAVPIPPALLQQQKTSILQELLQFTQMTGMPLEPGMLDDLDKRAERRVAAGVLLGSIARIEGIQLGDDDVEKRMAEIAEKTGKHIAKVRVEYSGERREQLENEILHERLMAFLQDKATVNEGVDPKAAEEAAQAAVEAAKALESEKASDADAPESDNAASAGETESAATEEESK